MSAAHEGYRELVRLALATVASDSALHESPALWEVASCDANHQGEWLGDWELCTLEEKSTRGDETYCSVRIVEDYKLCRDVPARFVRPSTLKPVDLITPGPKCEKRGAV